VDEHFYRSPAWFLNNVQRYDHYDRLGPKVFAGEYAAQVSDRANCLESALAEAAMMTGFERNAEVVRMAAYAPLFAHVDAWQWRPDLIWFDNLRTVATPDYYVQQLFSRNRGDLVLPVTLRNLASAPRGEPRIFASATRDSPAGEIILKVVNVETNAVPATVLLEGVEQTGSRATEIVLTGPGLRAGNSLDDPQRVAPRTRRIKLTAPEINHTFPPISLTVLRLRASP
jgi:alpha-N-arabinofuranosidase